MKILIVDDDIAMCFYLSNVLEKDGHQTTSCHDGTLALEILKSTNIDLLLTDWMMPNLSGIELCQLVRNDNSSENYIYIILLTGKNDKNDILKGYKAGVDDFISKPVLTDELKVRIKTGERLIKLQKGLLDRNNQLEVANQNINNNLKYIKESLQAAAKIQQTLLPSKPLKNKNILSLPVELYWEFLPADELAGDLFNFYRLDEHHIGLYIIDVVGHGVPAAMLSVYLHKMLLPIKEADSLIHDGEQKIRKPAEICSILNHKFRQDNDELYFTMIYAIINTQTGQGSLCQAGHPYPLIARKNGEVENLGFGGHPIGLFEDAIYNNIPFNLNTGDRFLLYSDAITECSNEKDEMFGMEKLKHAIKNNQASSLQQSIQALLHDVEYWNNKNQMKDGFDDDLSILALELT